MTHRTVGGLMTPVERVVTVRPGTPYKEIARLLTEHGISALPVVGDAEKVLGIVSEADLLSEESRSHVGQPALPPLTPAQGGRQRIDRRRGCALLSFSHGRMVSGIAAASAAP